MTEQVTINIPRPLFQRASELAQRRDRAVNEVLIELLEQALPGNSRNAEIVAAATEASTAAASSEDAVVQREMEAFLAMHPMLRDRYLGMHVAILDEQLIDYDQDELALYRRMDTQYPDRFVWLARVEADPLPTLVFRSPRLVTSEVRRVGNPLP